MKFFEEEDDLKEKLEDEKDQAQEESKADEASQADEIADSGRSGSSMDIDDENRDEEQEDKNINRRNNRDKNNKEKDNQDNDNNNLDNDSKNSREFGDNTKNNSENAQETPSREIPSDKGKMSDDASTPSTEVGKGSTAEPVGQGELGPANGSRAAGPGKVPAQAGETGAAETGTGSAELGASEGAAGTAMAEGGTAGSAVAGETASGVAGGTAGIGTGAVAEGAAGGAAAGTGGIAALGIAAIVILVIIALIGVAGFFVTMPQFLWNKLKSMLVDFWDGFWGYFVGLDETTVHEDDIKAVAQYLNDMGYDLVGMGFAQEVKLNKRDPLTGKLEDEDAAENQVLEVKAPYLNSYLIAENRTYMINNYTFNWRLDDIANIFKTGVVYPDFGRFETWGTGLIQLDQGLTTALSMPFKSLRIGEINVGELIDGVKVERSTNTLRIRRLNFDWFNTHNDYTYYSLKGWSGRYGKPFELSLTLHVATMAPDLVEEFCMNPQLDAKVNIRLRKSDINGKLKVDGMSIDELETAGTYDKETIKKLRDIEGQEIKTRIPYISSVTHHWFRNVYFEGSDSYGADTSIEIGVDEDEDDIEDYNEERGPKTQKSKKLTVDDSVYKFGGESSSGEFEYQGSDLPDLGGAKVTMDGTYSNGITQVKDAVRGLTNPVTKGLFKEKYYIYDGTVEKAERIQEAKKKNDESMKEEVKLTKESLSAFTILEESETLDAQFIYRDLKELVIELGYFEREDFDKIEKNVLEWPIPKYIPGEWPARKFEKQVVEYGTLIACEETAANAYGMSIADLRKLTGQKDEEKEKHDISLDGTLFIGDSYIVGLSQAGGINDAEWVCKSGMAANYFLPQIAQLPESARRIFVYLGVNNVRDTESMEKYIDALRAKYPNKKIYVSEVMHLGRNYNGGGANADRMNKAIDDYNAIIKKKCDSTDNVYYVITSEGIVVDGYLAHPDSEGIHMTGSDYQTWATNIANAIRDAGDLNSTNKTDEQFVIDFLKELKWVTTTAKKEGFTYGDAQYMPPNAEGNTNDDGIKRISCDRMVAWALYRMGYKDQPENGLTCGDMEGYLDSRGWKKIESADKVQIGDVCFSNPLDEEKTKPGHVFVCAGDGKRYDCGSKERIQLTGSYSSYTEQPFNENLPGDFMFAYRVTGDGVINAGFREDLDVISMCNGTVTEVYADGENIFSEGYLSTQVYGQDLTKEDEERFRPSEQTDEGLRIRIKDASLRNYQLVMYGFDLDDGISVGQELKAKDVIGKTKKSDICLILIDTDKAVCEDIEDYIKVPTRKTGKKNGMRIEDDFDVHDETNFIPDVETFIEMFKGYKNIVDNAEAFMEIQEKYQVNAAFAACVTIAESGGGTGWAAIAPYTYNWFSIKGSYHGKSYVSPTANKGPWRWYPSFAAAVDDFGDLIANGHYYYKQEKYTVNQIGPTYCNEKWSETVNKLMKTAYEKVI